MDDYDKRKGLPNMPPSDFWHDPLIIGIITTLFSSLIVFLVAYWIFLKQRTKKEITCQVVDDSSIVSVNEEVKDRIKIEFDGQKVEEMSVVKLKIWNSGNVSIKLGDYIDPITLNFAERQVLDVNIYDMEPSDLIKSEDTQKFLAENKPLPQKEKRTVTLPAFHINSKKRTGLQDSLTLKVLLSGVERSIRVEGRIDDGKIIKSMPESVDARFVIGKLNDYLLWFLMVLEGTLLIKFLLILFGAASNAFFAGFMSALTLVPLFPFSGIVPNTNLGTGGAAIAWSTLIAMAVYVLVFYAIRRFLHNLLSSPKEPIR